MISVNSNPKLIKVKSIIKEYALVSTVQGLSNIFRSERKLFKLIWLIVFLVSISLTIYMFVDTVVNFLEYEVVTKVEIIKEVLAKFPAVTFFSLKDPQHNVSLRDIMVLCKFNTQPCDVNNFDTLIDKGGFISYRFKPNESYFEGLTYGLSIIIDYGKYKEKQTDFHVHEGLQIIVHDHSTNPQYYGGLSNLGIQADAGLITSISMHKMLSFRLGEPYNHCLKDTSCGSFNSDIFKYIITATSYKYTQSDCFQYCFGREFRKSFNYTPKFQSVYDAWSEIRKNSNVSNSILVSTYIEFVKGKLQEVCAPFCPLECDQIRYDLSTSVSKFSLNSLNSFYNISLNKPKENYSLDDFVNFNVFYKDLSYTAVHQLAKTNIMDFVSNIGGIIGLFVGATFLSLVEILEVFIEITLILFKF